MKKEMKIIVLTSIIILLPIAVGLLLWNQLPEIMATHFNAQGYADGYSSKAEAVFLLPVIMLTFHIACILVTLLDPENRKVTRKINQLVLWIFPCLSVVASFMIYADALGAGNTEGVDIVLMMSVFVSLLFIIFGNYMPKCRQNHVIGIKIPWTLKSEENWNRTHRFAGRLWVTGGFFLLISAFLGLTAEWMMMITFLLFAVLPMIYSAVIYACSQQKKQ